MQGVGHVLSGEPGVWFWWVGAGVLLVIELMSGTFYLLMIALGFLLAGGSRLMGASGAGQILVAAVLALVAVMGVRTVKRAWRRRQGVKEEDSSLRLSPTPLAGDRSDLIDRRSQSDPAANMDVGAAVWVAQWDNGRARVRYRGAQWDAVLREGVAAAPGWYHIYQIDGIRLILGS